MSLEHCKVEAWQELKYKVLYKSSFHKRYVGPMILRNLCLVCDLKNMLYLIIWKYIHGIDGGKD